MLIENKWSMPRPVEYGRDIHLSFSKGNFSLRIRGVTGVHFELFVQDRRKEFTIDAHEISHLRQPQISFRVQSKEDIHLRVDQF